MEPQEVKKGASTILVAVLVGLLAVVIAGGGTWYVMDSKTKKDKEATDKQVTELQKQIDKSNKDAAKATPTTAPAVNTDKTNPSTYTNVFGKYSFELPEGYVVSEDDQGCEGRCSQEVKIQKKKNDSTFYNMYITIGVVKNFEAIKLEAAIKENQLLKDLSGETITIGNVVAKKFNVPRKWGTTKYIFINGLYEYSVTKEDLGAYPGPVKDAEMVVEKIISTFKFN